MNRHALRKPFQRMLLTTAAKTGNFVREQQPLWKKFKLLVLFNPFTEWGAAEGTKSSQRQIAGFVDFYHIKMCDFDPSDISAYPTFEAFFIRKHTGSSRPLFEPSNAARAICVADSRLVTYDSVSQSRTIWIKGKHFTIENLIQDKRAAQVFLDGSVASFRLSPQDYHRYHSPIEGIVVGFGNIGGDYYNVDPFALRSSVDILTKNHRQWVSFETKEFGQVLFAAIGATNVGTVKYVFFRTGPMCCRWNFITSACRIHEKWQQSGAEIRKGEEVGIFQFGGSSIIIVFEKGRIAFDDDLLSMSKRAIAIDVEVGMSLGKATRTG
ncbi:MAG: hypothetical protein Q9215_006234 [Flavoplaca cf. flavocitrina]